MFIQKADFESQFLFFLHRLFFLYRWIRIIKIQKVDFNIQLLVFFIQFRELINGIMRLQIGELNTYNKLQKRCSLRIILWAFFCFELANVKIV